MDQLSKEKMVVNVPENVPQDHAPPRAGGGVRLPSQRGPVTRLVSLYMVVGCGHIKDVAWSSGTSTDSQMPSVRGVS